jgi:hypothetical protein
MKCKYSCLKLSLVLGVFYSQWTIACRGEPSLAILQNRVRIIARSQNGLRLEAKHGLPEVLSVEPLAETRVSLKIIGQAKGFRDARSLVDQILGKEPRYEEYLIPNTLELIPASNEENESRYNVKLRDGHEIFSVELLFEGGSQKTLRGCGGGAAIIEKL